MLLNTKHTEYFSPLTFIIKKGGNIVLLAVVLLFSLSQGFAKGQDDQQVYSNGDNTIVYKATEAGNVVISKGTITAIEGKTIRLLPGTHIKSNEQLTVNIASKECQEAVAYEVSKRNEEAMLESSARKLEEIIPQESLEVSPVLFKSNSLPEENTTLGQQTTQLFAFMASTSVSFNVPVVTLLKSNESDDNYKSQNINRITYLPVTSWGACAESISIMRC